MEKGIFKNKINKTNQKSQCVLGVSDRLNIYLNTQLCAELLKEANESTEWNVTQQRHLRCSF